MRRSLAMRRWGAHRGAARAAAITVAVASMATSCGGDEGSAQRFSSLSQIVPVATHGSRSDADLDRSKKIGKYMEKVLERVNDYWKATFEGSGHDHPLVNLAFLVPESAFATECDIYADAHVAFYCPAEDRIYVGQQMATDLRRGFANSRPPGSVPSDFGVAYALAHEYAHDLQQQFGVYEAGRRSLGTELQADCLAGAWASSSYPRGDFGERDVAQAISLVYALGAFGGATDPEQNGTPRQRARAWWLGYSSGNPARCATYETSATG